MNAETIVKVEGLTKKYDTKAVVDNLSFEIKEGEILGLRGPNGAGKSTTMNMLCSLIKPNQGTIKMFGLDPKKDTKTIKSKIGYIPQELAIHENLKAWENVELFTSLYGIKKDALTMNESDKTVPEKIREIILDNTFEAVTNALKYSKCKTK